MTGQPVLQIRINQDEIARYGIPAKTILALIESLGSKYVGEVYEGQLRFPLVVRLPEKARADSEAIKSILVATPAGENIPLSRLATVESVEGPNTIRCEWYQRRITVWPMWAGGIWEPSWRRHGAKLPSRCNCRLAGIVSSGGQFENLQRAQTRLMLVVPVVLLMIFGLLYMTYRNVIDSVRVFTGVPFAWIGGIVALWIRDMPFSISAAVGFIALSGVAVLDDMLLVSTIRMLRRGLRTLDQAVEEAAMTRLRPILMTTLVASLGFVPMAFSTGMGAEVQRPLATVVIGGVCSAMIMSLLVLRVLYMIFNLPSRSRDEEGMEEPHEWFLNLSRNPRRFRRKSPNRAFAQRSCNVIESDQVDRVLLVLGTVLALLAAAAKRVRRPRKRIPRPRPASPRTPAGGGARHARRRLWRMQLEAGRRVPEEGRLVQRT